MATTNIDSVAEFKVLTNSYQAEYGRAVGGQIQVVTKSGTQNFRGSGYWYGRRSDWNANTWTNKRVTPEIEPAKTSRNDSGYTIGGPVAFPGFNMDKKRLFFFWSQEWQRRTDPATEHQTRVPTALERQGDFSQSVDSSGNPFPYVRDSSHGTAVQRRRHPRLLPGRWRARPHSAEPPLLARARRAEHLPQSEFLRGQRSQLHEPGSQQLAAPRGPAADGLPGHEQLAGHRPDDEEQGGHPAGVRDDLGRQRQRPAAHAGALHPPRFELPAVRHRHSEPDHVPRAELGTSGQLAELPTPAAAVVPGERRGLVAAIAVSRRGPVGLRSVVRLPRRAYRQRRPISDRSGAVHQREHHPRRHREPDQGLGRALLESGASTSSTASSRRASSPASTARSTSPTTPATPSTRGSATPTRRPACSTPTPRHRSTRCPSGATRTSSGSRRTTGSRAAG